MCICWVYHSPTNRWCLVQGPKSVLNPHDPLEWNWWFMYPIYGSRFSLLQLQFDEPTKTRCVITKGTKMRQPILDERFGGISLYIHWHVEKMTQNPEYSAIYYIHTRYIYTLFAVPSSYTSSFNRLTYNFVKWNRRLDQIYWKKPRLLWKSEASAWKISLTQLKRSSWSGGVDFGRLKVHIDTYILYIASLWL